MKRWKRHYNMLRGVNVDGCWIHELGRVKKEIRLFFKMRFQESEWERLRLDSGPLIRNIMNCWWLISKRMKLRQQYGIVVVPKALDQMDWILIQFHTSYNISFQSRVMILTTTIIWFQIKHIYVRSFFPYSQSCDG